MMSKISNVDFLKIDIQGGELNVFEHANKALDTATVVQTEVAFMPLYEGQPRFGEIEQAMRVCSFVPHTFIDMRTTSIAPVVFNNDPIRAQPSAGSRLCFREDFSNLAVLTSGQMQHYAMVIHSCYGSSISCTSSSRHWYNVATTSQCASGLFGHHEPRIITYEPSAHSIRT